MNFRIELENLKNVLALYFGVPSHKHIADAEKAAGEGDGRWVGDIMNELGQLGLMIAGGTITSLFTGRTVNDLDFYIKDGARLNEAHDYFVKHFHNQEKSPFQSRNAATYKRRQGQKVRTLQLISRFTGSPQEIMDWFDFTITQGVYDFSDHTTGEFNFEGTEPEVVQQGTFHFGPRFFQDIGKRQLVYLGKSKFPICALYRLKKYQERGYNCPGSTVMHIGLSIVQLEIKTYRDLKDQLMGIDTMYLQGLLGGPEYADDLPVDYGQFVADAFESINGFSAEDAQEQI